MVIYKITNKITHKVYIGQTRRDFELRIREHVNGAKNGEDFYLGESIRKYGWENFCAEIIAYADTIEELNQLEQHYIKEYDSINNGYNLAPGGDSNAMDSAAIKDKHDAKMRSTEVRGKISASVSKLIRENGRVDEYVSNMRAGFEAYKHSEKFKQDCANRHLSPEHFKALNDSKNKSVYCIDESGNIVAEFKRVKDAAQWWYDQGYVVKELSQLMDMIKSSSKKDRYIKGLKWIYRV